MSATISAKIPRKLKEKLRKLNVNVSQLVREALEREVKRKEEEQMRALAGEVSLLLRKIPSDELVRLVRETREKR